MSILSPFGMLPGKLIPARNSSAMTGSSWAELNKYLVGTAREDNIIHELAAGNIPNLLRNFIPVNVTDGNNTLSYLVMPDVLSIGNDEDYLRIPMSAPYARKIADQYDCILPTKKMADQIWKAAEVKISPHPKGPPYDASMYSTSNYSWHNQEIEKALVGKDKTKLISGHKKDVVLDKQWLTHNDRVIIYGWFNLNGVAIQGPLPNWVSHELHWYVDYSHGIRMIAQDVIINGQPGRILDVLNNPDLAGLISEEGAYDASSIYK